MKINDSEVDDKKKLSVTFHFFLFGIFAFSGAAGLIYEVVWVRQLTKILGASSYAVSVVLVSFMAGLGLGSLLIGKMADRMNPAKLVKAYVALEMGICFYALLFPGVLKLAERGYVFFFQEFNPELLHFQIFKLMLAFFLLVIPTTLMGATFPVLSRYLVRKKETISLRLSWLYSANTCGAIAGTLAAGYLLLPAVGIYFTTLLAILLNLSAAVGLLVYHHLLRGRDNLLGVDQAIIPGDTDRRMSPFQLWIVLGFGLSGSAAMFYQVAWTRILSMVLGTTTFAFTTMLATFLGGIALGSMMYGLWRKFSKIKLFIFFQMLAAFSALLTIPFFEKLPVLYLSMHGNWVTTWLDMQVLRFGLSALIMLLPTFALGAMFPVVSSLLIDDLGQIGDRVGKAYALNTLGAVFGAAGAGLVLVPLIGMQQTIILGGLINLLAGLGTILLVKEIGFSRRMVLVSGACLLAVSTVSLIQPWSPRIMNSGVYLYASRYQTMEEGIRGAQQEGTAQLGAWDIWEMAMKQFDLLYYETGATATVAVMEDKDGIRFLTIDGKTDASTGEKSDMRTQVMIGQLPMLFHKNPDKVLVVGLGSGVTAGSALTHDVRLVDVAEISPKVIEAAQFFSNYNHDALNDPRLRIIPRDARNVMLTDEEKYDVVISQPSNPWIKGEASLFTEEWYKLVKQHLGRGGLFVQWVPAYLMSDRDLKVIAHTLRTVFPHLTVWHSGSVGDLIFLASKGRPLEIDFHDFLQKVQKKTIAKDLARVGGSPQELLLSQYVMGEKDLVPYLYSELEKPLKQNTDDRPTIEFSTPKQLVKGGHVSRFADPEKRRANIRSLVELIDEGSRNDFVEFVNSIIRTWEAELSRKEI